MKKYFPFIILLAALLTACSQKENKMPVSPQAQMQLANAYYNNGLYEAAVKTYRDYLVQNRLNPQRRANTWYTIANIYFDRVHDYQKALEYYFKVKILFPESNLQKDVGKKIVSCLERLKRSTDAERYVQQAAALKPGEQKRPGAVLARIGKRTITQGDLDFEIQNMPAYARDQFKDKKSRQAFLEQYVMGELLYNSAKRQGLDKDKDVVEGAFRARKSLMAEKVLQKELQDKVKISPADVELYFKAHKDKYVQRDKKGKKIRNLTYNEAAQQAAQDLSLERRQEAYNELAQRLMKANDVTIYKDRVK